MPCRQENVVHSSSEICQPFFENAGTRLVRTQHKDNSFHGKRNKLQKIIRTTIWGVQLKSGDNWINEFDVSRFQIERTTKLMFIRLIYFLAFSNLWHICN
jgi:hypothetical protein